MLPPTCLTPVSTGLIQAAVARLRLNAASSVQAGKRTCFCRKRQRTENHQLPLITWEAFRWDAFQQFDRAGFQLGHRDWQKHNMFLSQLRNWTFILSKPTLRDIMVFLKQGCTQCSLAASDLLWLTYLLLIKTPYNRCSNVAKHPTEDLPVGHLSALQWSSVALTNVSVSERTTNQTLNGKKKLLVLQQHHLLSGPPAQSAQSAMSFHPHPPSAQLAYRLWVSRGWPVNSARVEGGWGGVPSPPEI